MSMAPELTTELADSILAAIRAGGFAHVAAAAFGVPLAVFKKWLRLGRTGQSPEYQAFAHNVAQAQGTARLAAEMETHKKDPRLWLRGGPGRETPHADGWTTFVRPRTRRLRPSDPFSSPVLLGLFRKLAAALAPFPEAFEAARKVGVFKQNRALDEPRS
jgi:hypothetical protein